MRDKSKNIQAQHKLLAFTSKNKKSLEGTQGLGREDIEKKKPL